MNPLLIIKRVLKKLKKLLLKLIQEIPSKQCYICKKKFFKFTKYKKNHFLELLECVGSDPNNFLCPHCMSTDRERHLFMYFDKLNFWINFYRKKILHFSPEKNLYFKIINEYTPEEYIIADINPENYSFCYNILKIDITNINFPDEYFDFIIANHVLEHLYDYKQALKEIYRVLRRNGIAILQTPFSKILFNNFSDKNIDNDYLREKFYGEKDHFIIFGKQLFDEIIEIGFKITQYNHIDLFDLKESKYYGVNIEEPLMIFEKI